MFLQKIFSEDVIFFLFCSPSVHYECYTSCKLWPLVTPLCSASSLEAVLYHNHSVKKFTGVYVLCNHNGDECVVFLIVCNRDLLPLNPFAWWPSTCFGAYRMQTQWNLS